jgi:uncharacterized protein (TIGR02598 family)
MHKRIPPEPSHRNKSPLSRLRVFSRHHAGFSLVEVAMSIAIIGFAFVALIGMLPSGMRVFRTSIDTANENWILQNVNATLQTTAWSKLDGMAAERGGDVFVYDEEGKLVDRVGLGSLSEPATGNRVNWQYVVRLLIEPVYRPNEPTVKLSEDSRLVTIVISQYGKAKSLEEFAKISKAGDLKGEGYRKNSGLRTRSFVVSRMDSAID